MPPPASNEGGEPLVFPDINVPNPARLAQDGVSSLIVSSAIPRFPYHVDTLRPPGYPKQNASQNGVTTTE